ncbi:hypothetical protein BD410DRAFT_786034 [Rickenella mellea]|uniref:DUF7330 domain-containing protein n=1 Tax=Rickenella mellea TaxID=50990 RepID=A0A4Y7QA29_9AGAM|nr:hypothetical protein BD410DRAFT_786034 [Rickenella mellea]
MILTDEIFPNKELERESGFGLDRRETLPPYSPAHPRRPPPLANTTRIQNNSGSPNLTSFSISPASSSATLTVPSPSPSFASLSPFYIARQQQLRSYASSTSLSPTLHPQASSTSLRPVFTPISPSSPRTEPPPAVSPTNHLAILRDNAGIQGTFVLDPELFVPPCLLVDMATLAAASTPSTSTSYPSLARRQMSTSSTSSSSPTDDTDRQRQADEARSVRTASSSSDDRFERPTAMLATRNGMIDADVWVGSGSSSPSLRGRYRWTSAPMQPSSVSSSISSSVSSSSSYSLSSESLPISVLSPPRLSQSTSSSSSPNTPLPPLPGPDLRDNQCLSPTRCERGRPGGSTLEAPKGKGKLRSASFGSEREFGEAILGVGVAGSGIVASGRGKRGRIEARSDNGSVTLRLHAPFSQRLSLSIAALNGPAIVELPRSFRGPVHTPGADPWRIHFRGTLEENVMPLNERQGRYFVGDWSGYNDTDPSFWAGDELHIDARNGSITLAFVDEPCLAPNSFLSSSIGVGADVARAAAGKVLGKLLSASHLSLPGLNKGA